MSSSSLTFDQISFYNVPISLTVWYDSKKSKSLRHLPMSTTSTNDSHLHRPGYYW